MNEKKDLDSIMRDITRGLSGDPKADMAYLNEQMEKYKDHEMNTEILRACGRLQYGLIPDDKKSDLERHIKNAHSGTDAALEEVRFNIYKKDFKKALNIIEALVNKVEALNAFEDDRLSEYHVFNEVFEEFLYMLREKPEKDLRRAPIPYTDIYMLYGSLLVELKRYEEARAALKKGLRWNPVSFPITSEYIETYKIIGDFEKFFDLTKKAFKIAFRSKDVARCYRNLGFWFVEQKLWSEAVACYHLSTQFEPDSKQAQSELYYIYSSTGQIIREPSWEQLKEIGEAYGFPIGADNDVLSLSFSLGRKALDEGAYDAAGYFLSITYDLTGDEKIAEMINSIPKSDEERT